MTDSNAARWHATVLRLRRRRSQLCCCMTDHLGQYNIKSLTQCCRYGVTKEPTLNRQMLGLMARELTLVDSKARRHVHNVLAVLLPDTACSHILPPLSLVLKTAAEMHVMHSGSWDTRRTCPWTRASEKCESITMRSNGLRAEPPGDRG